MYFYHFSIAVDHLTKVHVLTVKSHINYESSQLCLYTRFWPITATARPSVLIFNFQNESSASSWQSCGGVTPFSCGSVTAIAPYNVVSTS